jgi:hypothetical protein
MRTITDGKVIENGYTPPEVPKAKQDVPRETLDKSFVLALSNAIVQGFRSAVLQMPASTAAKPEIKINSPVYVTAPEVKVPRPP